MPDKGTDILEALKNDHDTLRDLFSKMEATTERATTRRVQLLDKIATEIRSHADAEEEVFYTRFKERAEEDEQEEMYYEAKEEHHVVDLVLPELLGLDPSTPEFTAKATVLKELIEHHAEEEEQDMFKKARKMFKIDERREMGEAFLSRKKQIARASRPQKSAGDVRREQRA